MTSDPKVVQLVVNKEAEQVENAPDVAISVGAQIKYFDDEVTLLKMKYDIGGQVNGFQHFIIQTPKK
jgi:hypothetical protein